MEAAAQSALAVSAAPAAASAAMPASAPAPLAPTVAATAAVPAPAPASVPAAGAAATPLPDPPHAAPALVTDSPPPRQLSIQIPRSVLVAVPLAGLALFLFVSLLPKPATPVDAAEGRAELAAPDKQTAPAPAAEAPEGVDATEDGAEHDVAEPELSQAALAQLRERTRQAQQLSEARERVKVTLFYTERCPHCSEARGYLTAHGVRAEQYDIDKDPKARARYLRLNPKGSLPTLVVEKQVLAGFDADRLEHAIDRAARARLAPAPKKRKR